MTDRDQYVEKLKAQLDEWNAQIKTWEGRSAEVQTEARAEWEKQLDAFRRQRDQGLEQMRQIQAASIDAWHQWVRGADDAWARMREAFEKASAQHPKP